MMSSETLRLFLINDRNQERLSMSIEELKVWVKTVPRTVLVHYRIQIEGREEWHELERVELDALAASASSAALDQEITIIDAVESLATAPRAKDSSRERRRSPRVNMRRRTIIVSGGIVYRTFTVDASVDGLRLEHPVPRELQGCVVDCYLSSQDLLTGVLFKAVMVENGNQAVRLKFLEQDAKSLSTLGRWLSSQQKKSA